MYIVYIIVITSPLWGTAGYSTPCHATPNSYHPINVPVQCCITTSLANHSANCFQVHVTVY